MPADTQAKDQLLDVVDQATKSSGAIFTDENHVNVRPPLLSALISLDQRMSPVQIDATSSTEVNLHDVLVMAMDNNLPIKISSTESDISKWGYKAALTKFLPNLSNEVAWEYLSGAYASPAGLAIPIRNPYFSSKNSIQQYLFKGGSIIHGAKAAKDTYKATRFALAGTTNDVLLNGSKLYYDLVLNDVLLQIRIKAVEVAQALVVVNEDQFANGANTKLDVLQAKYQLSDDRQKLIAQQIARRQSAVNLAAALNTDTGVDLLLKERTVGKVRLVDNRLMPGDLLRIAIENRPDLKRFEQLRLAALQAIKVAKATLLPQVTANGTAIGTSTRVVNTNTSSNSNSAQSTPISVGSSGVGAIADASGFPLTGNSNASKKLTGRSLFEVAFDLQYNLGGLGLYEWSQIQEAKLNARRVSLEEQQAMQKVYKEVRDAFLGSISAENLIVETTAAVAYAEESLRLAEVRFKEGVGTYLEVLTAERNYEAALVNKAQSLIQFNVSQVQLLYAIGRISVTTAVGSAPVAN
jgi:outer membrane protein